MASEVQICNLALANLGDTATVASLNPPEGSAQAEHCARFYPIARDALIEMHAWDFCMKRVTLALTTSTVSGWQYCYAVPSDMVDALSIIPSDSSDDYSTSTSYDFDNKAIGGYTPQPFQIELVNGSLCILTNQENAVLRYKIGNSDTTKFTSLFVVTLAWYLASMLAGPIIKGDAGAAESKRCLQMFQAHLVQATSGDSVSRCIKPTHSVVWLSGR